MFSFVLYFILFQLTFILVQQKKIINKKNGFSLTVMDPV